MKRIALHKFAVALSVLFFGVASLQAQTQNVWVQFLPVGSPGASTLTYTPTEQADVLSQVQTYYAPFGGSYSFSLSDPGGTRSIVQVNAATSFSGGALTGGIAQQIDFRNLSQVDQARVQIVGLLGGGGQPANTSANRVNLTSFIVTHELGHLLGLRHGDSYGPIGSGLPTSGVPAGGDFLPTYTGPSLANETGNRMMASPASVGQTLFQAAAGATVNSFSEREAVKLAFNTSGSVVAEQAGAHGSIATAQAITLSSLNVPNPLLAGALNAGKIFNVQAVAVTGRVNASLEQDWYSFTTTVPNALINIDVISATLAGQNRGTGTGQNPFDSLDTTVLVTDSLGNAVPYYGAAAGAFNDDEVESLESRLLDLTIANPGTYFIRVQGFDAAEIGNYELYAYQFAAAVPEPVTMGLIGSLVCAAGVVWHRRRKALKRDSELSPSQLVGRG